jgi:hypothetical protein
MTRWTAAAGRHWQLALMCLVLCALWSTPLVLPLKLLVVLFHELSHAAATLLTGGEVVSIHVTATQGGQVISLGGNRFAILCAGYIGSLAIGVALFVAALRTNLDRAITATLGALLVATAAFYLQGAFALGFAAGTGAALIAAAAYLSREINDMVLRILGMGSMIYVPMDIFDDTIRRTHLDSDARMLATEFGGTTIMWGAAWLALAVLSIAACLRYGLGHSSNIAWRRTAAG